MPTNVYFNHAVQSEQDLHEDLVVESLRFYGHECFYLPRTIVDEDELFGEDTSFFTDSDSIIEPEYEEIYDKVAKEMLYLHDSTVIMKKKITIHADSSFMLKGVSSFQTCDDVHGLPPFSEEFSLTVSGCNENLKPNEKTSNNLIFLIIGGEIIFMTAILTQIKIILIH